MGTPQLEVAHVVSELAAIEYQKEELAKLKAKARALERALSDRISDTADAMTNLVVSAGMTILPVVNQADYSQLIAMKADIIYVALTERTFFSPLGEATIECVLHTGERLIASQPIMISQIVNDLSDKLHPLVFFHYSASISLERRKALVPQMIQALLQDPTLQSWRINENTQCGLPDGFSISIQYKNETRKQVRYQFTAEEIGLYCHESFDVCENIDDYQQLKPAGYRIRAAIQVKPF